MCFGLIGSFLDEKGSKKLEKRLKVDIVETLTETIMEGIQERIDNLTKSNSTLSFFVLFGISFKMELSLLQKLL